jgi:hypothetical protein
MGLDQQAQHRLCLYVFVSPSLSFVCAILIVFSASSTMHMWVLGMLEDLQHG